MKSEPWTTNPSSASTSSEDSTTKVSGRRKCRVPRCPNSNCKLITHRKYKPGSETNFEANPQKINVVSSDLGQLLRRDPHTSIQREGVDGLPTLPGAAHDPELKLLFHHFFASVFEPLAHVFRGPSIASMSEYKNRMLSTALSSESYCMGLIVQSQTDLNISRHEVVESRKSIGIYLKAVACLRQQVETVDKSPNPLQIELALLSLCTLISYDAFHGRDVNVLTHWTGLKQLVERRGGLHCVTISLAYVVHVDRMCAQRLNQRPAFSNPAVPTLPLPRPRWPKYGGSLYDSDSLVRRIFTPGIIDHCIETCVLLELWEISHDHLVSEPQNELPLSIPSLEYLYYVRDRVDEQFAMLHADVWDQDVRDKFLLWAARIVEYPVTWSNQIPTLNTYICDHLLRSLRSNDLSEVWKGNTNMLAWILFTLATVQTPFDGRGQVILYLRRLISLKHDDQPWPYQWWKQELKNAQSFIWSDSHNTSRFHDVCRELEAGAVISDTVPLLMFLDESASGIIPIREPSEGSPNEKLETGP